jgi:hypothetical protein
VLDLPVGVLQLAAHRAVDGILLLGPIERHPSDPIRDPELDRFSLDGSLGDNCGRVSHVILLRT